MKESKILLLSHNQCFICYSHSVELTDWGRWEKELKEKEKRRVQRRTGVGDGEETNKNSHNILQIDKNDKNDSVSEASL